MARRLPQAAYDPYQSLICLQTLGLTEEPGPNTRRIRSIPPNDSCAFLQASDRLSDEGPSSYPSHAVGFKGFYCTGPSETLPDPDDAAWKYLQTHAKKL